MRKLLSGYEDLKRAIMRVPPGKIHCNTKSWCEELPYLLGVDATEIQHAEDLQKISSQVAWPQTF